MTDQQKNALLALGDVRIAEPMCKHTSFGIGGAADALLIAQSQEQIVQALHLAAQECLPVFIMGNGSNLLVRDGGIRGLVIKIAEGMNQMQFDGWTLYAQAGATLIHLARTCMQKNLAGLECVGGIPGTLGGAVYMNAGAYGAEICEVIRKVYYIDSDLCCVNCDVTVNDFGYRTSVFAQTNAIVTAVELALMPDDRGEARKRYDACNLARRTKQPLQYPCAGSVFKRPVGYYAGKLIQDCGLMGTRMGGAEVSQLHAGFIINCQNATAQDVTALIQHIQTTVYEKFGVNLEPEIRIVGEE